MMLRALSWPRPTLIGLGWNKLDEKKEDRTRVEQESRSSFTLVVRHSNHRLRIASLRYSQQHHSMLGDVGRIGLLRQVQIATFPEVAQLGGAGEAEHFEIEGHRQD